MKRIFLSKMNASDFVDIQRAIIESHEALSKNYEKLASYYTSVLVDESEYESRDPEIDDELYAEALKHDDLGMLAPVDEESETEEVKA